MTHCFRGRHAGAAAARWLAACLLAFSAALASAQVETLRYGLLAELPPFQVWPEGGEPGGADLALVQVLAGRLNLQLRPVRYTSWRSLEADLLAGRIDLASAVRRNATREQDLAFTTAYWRVRQALVTRRDAPSGALTPDLAGRIVAVVNGYPSEVEADQLFPLATRAVVDTVRQSLRDVASGRADVAFEALPVVLELIEHEQLKGLHVARTLELPTGALHLALPASRQALAQRLSQEIVALAPGAVEALVRRWSATLPLAERGATFVLDERDRSALAALPAPVIAVVGGHRPFIDVTPGSEPSGLTIDMLRAVLQRLGLQPRAWRVVRLEDLAGLLARGEVDWVIGAEESAQYDGQLRFIGPYMEQPVTIIGRRDAVLLDLGQLRGRRLALPAGHAGRTWVDSRYPAIDVVACLQLADCVDAVEQGRADATLADVIGAATLLAERPRATVQLMGAVPELRVQHSLALAARHGALAALAQRALDASASADLPELKTRWLNAPTPAAVQREAVRRWAPWVGGVLAGLLALWWAHSRRLKREVRRRQAAQQHAERASQTSARFVTFLAHEVRNSLHSVIAGTELLRHTQGNQPSIAAGLRESARSTLTLLNNLLDRDRLEAGRLSLHLESAHLDPVLRSVALEMGPAAQARQLTLRYRPGAWDPLLRIDAMRVQQVIRNLVANAIKYCERGEIAIESRCEVEPGTQPRCRVEIVVRDQGPGVAPEDQAHLFEPFFVAGDSTAAGARTGLGLALCRDIAQLMGGELTLDSRRGEGLAIALRWTAEFEAEPEPAARAKPAPPRRVLLVEDAEVYAMLIEHALAAEGCPVVVAGSVAGAEAALAREAFDVVLTDLHLVDGGAARVIAAARRAAGEGALPTLVVMSAELHDADVQALRDAGAELVLAKASDATLFVRQLLQHPALRAPAELAA
ncbi:transporter substrate-binding domain-containing protein [Aquincola sp. S2]|uniref:histidine kinase n=1 Tax=Pseudaquabacterium terrae TaxID=2732868 RepID=A0ABX2ELF3_9BURK|nr:transporter substrate-binding domain-containing protein [Aquabacterium terrae]NRF69400.1 transporter substrate-binding domain-containing protein [Aquabacterium terrae]